MALYDEERAYYLAQLAAGNIDEATPLHDLRKMFYASRLTENVIPVLPGDSLADALKAAAAAAGGGWVDEVYAPYYDGVAAVTCQVMQPIPHGTRIHAYDSGLSEPHLLKLWVYTQTGQDPPNGYIDVDCTGCSDPADFAYALWVALMIYGNVWSGASVDGDTISLDVSQGDAAGIACELDGILEVECDGEIGGQFLGSGGYWKPVDDPVPQLVLLSPKTVIDGDVSLPPYVSIDGQGSGIIQGALACGEGSGAYGLRVTGDLMLPQGQTIDSQTTAYSLGLDTRHLAVRGAEGIADAEPVTFSADDGLPRGPLNMVLAGGQTSNSHTAALLDAQIPGPYFTNARCLVSLIIDDAGTSWDTVMSGLGDKTPLVYLVEHNIPATWGIIYSAWDKDPPESVTKTNLVNALRTVGGEVAWHEHFPSKPAGWARAQEIIVTSDAIAQSIQYPVMTSLHTGDFDPGVQWNAHGICNRLRHAVCRTIIGPAVGLHMALMPVSRYPFNSHKPSGMRDSDGAVHWFRRLVHTLGASVGKTYAFYIHNVQASETPGSGNLSVAQFIALVEALEEEQAAGTIALVPAWQLASTFPTGVYDAEQGILAPNLILNPGFEYKDTGHTDDGFSFTDIAVDFPNRFIHVIKSGGSTIEITDTEHAHGSRSCKLVRSTGSCRLVYPGLSTLHAGRTLRLRFWHKTGAGTNAARVYFYPNGPNNQVIQHQIPVSAGTWAQAHLNYTAPLGATYVEVQFEPGTNTTWYLDDIYFGH